MRITHLSIGLLFAILLSCERNNNQSYGTSIEIPSEVNTIKEALRIANANDTILLSPGEYNEWGLIIDKALTITSRFNIDNDSSLINETIINGGDNSRIFTIDNVSGNVKLDGFTITNASAELNNNSASNPEIYSYNGGGLYCLSTDLVLANLIISNNYAGEPTSRGAGGGLYIDKSNVLIDNVKLFENSSINTGGAIYCDNSSLKVLNSKIFQNKSWYGGPPISIWNSQIDFKSVIISNNKNEFEQYPEIGFFICQGILENVTVINDSIKIQESTIEIKDCNIPGY